MSKDGFIELGKSYNVKDSQPVGEAPQHVDYPTLYINHGDESSELNDLPEEGEAVIRFKIKRFSEDYERDTCSCELSVLSIKPITKREKKKKSSEDSLDEEFERMSKKRRSE